jgi:tRNA modification GTPase
MWLERREMSLSVGWICKGLAVSFLDTAGLRDSKDEIEKLGISKAYETADAADIRVFLIEEEGEPLAITMRDGDIVRLNKGDERGLDVEAVSWENRPRCIRAIEPNC